jgi:acid phosphatase (class A)
MKPRPPLTLSLLSLLLLVAAAPSSQNSTHYVAPTDFDIKAILSPPPADGSAEQKAEIEQMLKFQAGRTPEDVARCKAEVDVTAFAMSDVLGAWFNAKDLPETAKLMQQIYGDADALDDAAKVVWDRNRPPLSDSRIKPCVKVPKSNSYPSGHATRGLLWATVLAEIFPEHKDQLLARGRQIGTDRTLAGVHYPSDVAAGQKLAEAIVPKLLQNAQFKADLEKAKAECLADAAKQH